MSVDEGTIRAQLELTLAQFQAQVDVAIQQTEKLGAALKNIPSAEPKIKPPVDDATKVKNLANEVADALKKLTGGRVDLDIGQMEKAGADAQKILTTLQAGFASTAVTAAVASAAIVGAVLAIEHVLVEMGEHWEAAFRKVSVATGLTGHDLEAFEQTVVNVAKSSAASTDAIAAAASTLQQRLGVTGPALEALTSQVTKFAKVTGQDAGDAAKSLSQILTQFHIPVEQASDTLNVLLRVAQQTGIPFQQLEDQLKGRLGPVLQAIGFSFTESALFLANMAKQGDAGRSAIAALSKVLQEAADAGKAPQVVYADLVEKLKAAGDTSTVTGAALAKQLGPAFGLLSTLAKNGGLDVKTAADRINESGDTVNEAFDRMRSGAEKVGAQLTILKNQFAPIGIEIAKVINQLETDFAGAIAKVTEQVKALQAQIDKLPSAGGQGVTPTPIEAAIALGVPIVGVPIAAGLAARRIGTQSAAPEPHGAEPTPGASEGTPGVPPPTAAPTVQALTDQISKLDKAITEAGTNTALIEQLERTKQGLEATQKATEGLDAATTARLISEQHAASIADQTAQAARKAADETISYAGVLRQQAADAAVASDAADRLHEQYLAEPGLLAASAHASDALTTARLAAADADVKRKAASEALQAASTTEADATRLVAAAEAAEADAAEKNAKAHDDAIAAHAQFAVVAERTNAIIGAAKPFLDAASEAAIKAAEGEGHFTEAITIAGHAMGLTDDQIQALVGSLGASQQKFDQTTNSIKALTIPTETLQARLGELATSAYPNLSKAQADALQQTIKSGDATKEAAALAATYGVSVEELNQHLDDSKAHFDEWAKQVAAANRPLADFVSDENKSRISSVLGTLASATDSVTAAQAKQAEQSGHAADALALLLQHAGAGPAAVTALTQALQAGGAAAFDAQEKIKALVTYARDPSTGTIRLKVDIDIDAAQKAIYDLQNNYQKAQQGRAEAETKATHEFSIQQQAAAAASNQVQTDYRTSVLAISQARQDSQQQLGRDINTASDAANKATSKVDQTIDDAIAKHTQAIQDAQTKYAETVATAVEAFRQGTEGLADRARSIMQQAADAAAQALRQVSGAMQSFNDQARITANATSIQQQSAQLASYGFTDFQSQQSALRAAEIQAQGTAGLAQVAGANQLNQTLVGANQSLQKATEKAAAEMDKLGKEITKLNETYQKQLAKAQEDLDKTTRDADQTTDKAIRDANQLREQTTKALSDAMDQAFDKNRQQQKALDDKAQAEQQKFFDQLTKEAVERGQDPEGKFRTRQEQAFDEAEAKRHKDDADAAEKYLEDLKKAKDTLDALLALKKAADELPDKTAKAITERFNASPQQFTYNGLTIQETQVDFQAAATAELARRVRSRT